MAAAGGAVGLGNIWKFPYIAGENGGGAFLIIYLLCVIVFGLPLLVTEFMIGKRSGKSAHGAFRQLSGNNRWQWLGWLSMLTAVIIMGFYFVVTGWCFNYLVEAFRHTFQGQDAAALNAYFDGFVDNVPRVLLYSVVPVVLTASVLWFDVNKGIEKLSKILMPLLLIMMLLMAGRVLMLDGSNVGMQFFFRIDFSQITPHVVLEAMGQCFFSLSIGMGALITYGSYMPRYQSVTAASVQVAVLDTLVAVLAGVIIFPAVFAFGFNPAEGPELAFVVLPAILEKMSFAWLSGVLFFGLLCIAAVTSTISLMEVVVAFFCEATAETRHPLNRHKSVLLVSAIAVLMIALCVVANLFDLYDKITSCIMMPLGAMGMSIFVGWVLSRNGDQQPQFNAKGIKRPMVALYLLSIRWIVPIAILLIFLYNLGLI